MHLQVRRTLHRLVFDVGVGAAIDQIDVRKEAFTRPHSPVCVTFKPRLSLLKKLVMDAPQKLPTEPIIGPLRPLPVGCNAGKLVWAAVQSARRDLHGITPTRHRLKLTEPRPICGKLRSVASQERTPRLARACAVGLSPGWCGDLYSNKQSVNWQHRVREPGLWNGHSPAWWKPGIGRSTL